MSQGRYTWRHNQVLKEVAQCVEEKRTYCNKKEKVTKRKHIAFVKVGEIKKDPAKETKEAQRYLELAQDWNMRVGLDQRLKVPDWIVQTNHRPDILIISEKTKQMGAIELTVPSEERVEASGELKRAKD